MISDALTEATILVVDDQEANVRLLEGILRRAGYPHVHGTTDPTTVVALVAERMPDLILLDLLMPRLDGFAVLTQLATAIPHGVYVPKLVLTADVTREARERALALGANDFLTKPFDATEVLLRIGNLLQTRFLYRRLERHNAGLERLVRERTAELEDARLEALDRLACAAEYRDDQTGDHARRVGHTAGLIAWALGLPPAEVDLIRRAAPLHDVGKIGIPDWILLKPGKLSPAEFAQMQRHTCIGAELLGRSQVPLLRLAEEIALTHHERWDGGGYPRGLAGTEIPLPGRIVAVADIFDAMTTDRPYQTARPCATAVAYLAGSSGQHTDPAVVEAFLRVFNAGMLDPMRGAVARDARAVRESPEVRRPMLVGAN